MTTQAELPLYVAKDSSATTADVESLYAVLAFRGWLKARDIITSRPHWTERKVRAIAEASAGHIVSGQEGYKLTQDCTPDEIQRACDWLRSQAKKMTQRALNIMRVTHQPTKG